MITKKDLQIGHMFITSTGEIAVYFGQTKTAKFVFYKVASIFGFTDKEHSVMIHKEIQIPLINTMIKQVLSKQIYEPKLYSVKNLTYVVDEYKDIEPFTKEFIKLYLQKNQLQGVDILSNLAELNETDVKSLFVKASDLVPGHVYYSGDGWRSMYVYLGRDNKKNFLWYFVGNEETMRKASYKEMLSRADRTKTNKKVKDVWNYALDEEVWGGVKELGQEKFAKSF